MKKSTKKKLRPKAPISAKPTSHRTSQNETVGYNRGEIEAMSQLERKTLAYDIELEQGGKRIDPDAHVPAAYKTKDFIKERRKWYKLLKEEGFNDIEYDQGPIQYSHFKETVPPSLGDKDGQNLYRFYFKLRCFLAHNPRLWDNRLSYYKRFIAKLLAEGVSYRKIVALNKASRMKHKFSVFVVFRVAKEFYAMSDKWHREDPKGYDNSNPGNDFFVADIPIREYDDET